MRSSKIFIFFLAFSFFVALSTGHGKQEKALDRLLKVMFNGKSGIDTKLYTEVEITSQNEMIEESKVVLSEEGLKEKDRITMLPGQPENFKFTQYGGYITVDEHAGRAFYYYFVEAETSKESQPLLLWLNGGPGCSSLAYGAMQELGPFRVTSDGKKLFCNPYAWNRVANVLFVESPAGVGFSYSNTTSDYNLSGDQMTAKDNYAFLVNWFKRFPEYKTRAFYISGESYAGHYVPQLTHTILKHNEHVKSNQINLKGIIIGNAWINAKTDTLGMFEYFWTHALISDKAITNIRNYCGFSPNATDKNHPQLCFDAQNEVNRNVNPINIYNIYASTCLNSNLTDKPKRPTKVIDPCSDHYTWAYMNTPEVQDALHANVTKLLNYTWEACSDVIPTWADSPSTMLPLLEEFLNKGLRVWLFSGDTDGRIPVTSTRYSLNTLNLPIKIEYYPWFLKRQVGGYSMVYNVSKGDLTFATVRGAGHEVPSYKPAAALALIEHFLDGTPLPPK